MDIMIREERVEEYNIIYKLLDIFVTAALN